MNGDICLWSNQYWRMQNHIKMLAIWRFGSCCRSGGGGWEGCDGSCRGKWSSSSLYTFWNMFREVANSIERVEVKVFWTLPKFCLAIHALIVQSTIGMFNRNFSIIAFTFRSCRCLHIIQDTILDEHNKQYFKCCNKLCKFGVRNIFLACFKTNYLSKLKKKQADQIPS